MKQLFIALMLVAATASCKKEEPIKDYENNWYVTVNADAKYVVKEWSDAFRMDMEVRSGDFSKDREAEIRKPKTQSPAYISILCEKCVFYINKQSFQIFDNEIIRISNFDQRLYP